MRIGYLYPKAWSSRPNPIIPHYFVVSGIFPQHIGFHRHVPRNARVSWWRGAVVDVCEIGSHVIHRTEELLCVAVCAERPLGVLAVFGRALPHLIGELEVADAQELLWVSGTIGN